MGGVQITVVFDLDDIMTTWKDREKINEVYKHLGNAFKEVTIIQSNVYSYLGMTFDFSQQRMVRVTMQANVEDLLREFTVGKISPTPASERLFEIR